jgi:sigma-E factor negative regulatory protein RseC
MAEHIGIVIKKESNRFAQVVTDRKGACGGCESTPHGCHSCLSNGKMESRVANPVGAEIGDVVKINLSSGNLYTGAAVLYLLPILGLLLGAFAGLWASTAYHLAETVGSIAGAVAGLGIGLAAVIVLDRSPRFRSRITPTITAVVKPKGCIPKINAELNEIT